MAANGAGTSETPSISPNLQEMLDNGHHPTAVSTRPGP